MMPSQSRTLAQRRAREALCCPRCESRIPVGVLVTTGPPDAPEETHVLSERDYLVGRAPECDLRIGDDRQKLSRSHARLHWAAPRFEIADAGSRNGTWVNGRRLGQDERAALVDGDQIALGDLELAYFETHVGPSGPGWMPFRQFLGLVRDMSSLDADVVVQRALELLRRISGVERSYIVDAGVDPRMAHLLTPLDDPDLRVSRSSIQQALETGKRVSHSISGSSGKIHTRSVEALDLHRIWVSPVPGLSGRPVAAVYLDSTLAGEAFDDETERLMDALVEQIGMALRNASLHVEVLSLNEGLEQKVAERTRELEDSRARLIGQDRLATLGKLVAAIAHELNNPVGAITSLSETLQGLRDPILKMNDDLGAAFPDPGDLAAAQKLAETALDAASRVAPDTRARRELEGRLDDYLRDHDVTASETIARRLARSGLDIPDVEPALDLLRRRGDMLTMVLERLHTFGRGLQTIRSCASNVARIVDGLKTYAHLDLAHLEEADIHRGIQATLAVLAPRFPKGVTVETHFDSIAPFPHRPGELTQVWTNLVDNALRAMGESGTLIIATHDEESQVRVTVTDTGQGVPDAIRGRIFDIDVTTRGPGAGLGLGLPICRTIVERNHGGRIAFESRPGRTVFSVTLPKTPPAMEAAP